MADLGRLDGYVARFLSAFPRFSDWQVEKVAIAPSLNQEARQAITPPPLTNLEYTLGLFKETAAHLTKAPGRLRGFDRVSLRSQGLLARLACSFPLLRSLLRLRLWAICCTAFQADDAGSIPAARFLILDPLVVPLPSPARPCGGPAPAAGHRPARLG